MKPAPSRQASGPLPAPGATGRACAWARPTGAQGASPGAGPASPHKQPRPRPEIWTGRACASVGRQPRRTSRSVAPASSSSPEPPGPARRQGRGWRLCVLASCVWGHRCAFCSHRESVIVFLREAACAPPAMLAPLQTSMGRSLGGTQLPCMREAQPVSPANSRTHSSVRCPVGLRAPGVALVSEQRRAGASNGRRCHGSPRTGKGVVGGRQSRECPRGSQSARLGSQDRLGE